MRRRLVEALVAVALVGAVPAIAASCSDSPPPDGRAAATDLRAAALQENAQGLRIAREDLRLCALFPTGSYREECLTSARTFIRVDETLRKEILAGG